MKPHESTEDFKARIAALLRDQNEPEAIVGARRADPCVLRPGSITWNKNVKQLTTRTACGKGKNAKAKSRKA